MAKFVALSWHVGTMNKPRPIMIDLEQITYFVEEKEIGRTLVGLRSGDTVFINETQAQIIDIMIAYEVM